MNKTRGQNVLKILNGGVESLNYPTPPGSKFPISWVGWRCELGGSTPTPPSNLTLLRPFSEKRYIYQVVLVETSCNRSPIIGLQITVQADFVWACPRSI